ncbi:hypothetical protein CDD83_10449 [Cordyceps sp. RAO-2017]|nr:hypothetical protein CDD83_10449 [Cordyceps sp. RAO-2017]
MFKTVGLERWAPARTGPVSKIRAFSHSRLNADNQPRSVLSRYWQPTGRYSGPRSRDNTSRSPGTSPTGYEKLIRAGCLRQAHLGIFQLLPLGLRVQKKIESLLDKHMQSIGASRLALSSITSEELWKKSNRLDQVSPELFRFNDRRKVPLMLSPTHEEEITALVKSTLTSYRDLPLRLYQITRKYRDERRPRHGLLRSREFVMKDLYTFDLTFESATRTYVDVSDAYRDVFAELKLPVLVAEASSGDMGGDWSHEYHLPHHTGEDKIVACDECDFVASDEVATARPPPENDEETRSRAAVNPSSFGVWRGITKDRKTLVNAWYPCHDDESSKASINVRAVEAAVPELDSSISDPLQTLSMTRRGEPDGPSATLEVVNVVDRRLAAAFGMCEAQLPVVPHELGNVPVQQSIRTLGPADEPLNLLRLVDGDGCPRCEAGTLRVQRSLELGHTFCLGTRYSKPLELVTQVSNGRHELVQMGCYGIGVSRIIGAVAEHMADEKGLNWPRAIAPFEVAVIPSSPEATPDVLSFFDRLAGKDIMGSRLDIVLDDRELNFGWKIRDADMMGYPVIVVLGRGWRERGLCEVQCRRLGVKESVTKDIVGRYVDNLLSKL